MAQVEEIGEAQACDYLSRFRLVDPLGRDTVATAVRGCRCWRVSCPAGCVVFAMRIKAGRAWVSCAAGETRGMTATLLAAIEDRARAAGAGWVGFQTVRRGMLRRVRPFGYVETKRSLPGFAMEKNLAVPPT